MKKLWIVLFLLGACGEGDSHKPGSGKILNQTTLPSLTPYWETLDNSAAQALLLSTRWCSTQHSNEYCHIFQYSDYFAGEPLRAETQVTVSCQNGGQDIHESYTWSWQGSGLIGMENERDHFRATADIKFRRNEDNQIEFRASMSDSLFTDFTACKRE